ncbi:hypothetical protein HanRHA438_Chr03g0111161 [Helianthus annuus]|nr:hypothetical protein HanRHA438_Chr03g0111161 [Helianthus annuus]
MSKLDIKVANMSKHLTSKRIKKKKNTLNSQQTPYSFNHFKARNNSCWGI